MKLYKKYIKYTWISFHSFKIHTIKNIHSLIQKKIYLIYIQSNYFLLNNNLFFMKKPNFLIKKYFIFLSYIIIEFLIFYIIIKILNFNFHISKLPTNF